MKRRPIGSVPLMLCTGVVVSIVALGLGASAVGAAGPAPSDVCKKLTANFNAPTGTVSACVSDGPVETPPVTEKGSGTFALSALTSGSGTVTWKAPYEGGTAAAPTHTDLNSIVNTAVGGTNQPPDEPETAAKACPTGTQEIVSKGKIGPTDTTDGPNSPGDVGGTFTAEICFDGATGNITLEPGSTVRFSEPPGGGA